ncbi:MAG TPA: phage protease [Casimicrobiaceae bacterium]
MSEPQSDTPKRTWIQLAQVGTFKGHPSGPFHLDPSVFSTMVRNFDRDGLPIPIDAEHASEMPATQGNIPSQGAPAMGWIHKLQNRGDQGLWGNVEWLEPARSYIKEGRYKFISPAIRWKSKDRTTGLDVGPRISSAGMTNQPFLPSMAPLTAAKNADGEPVYMLSSVGIGDHSTDVTLAGSGCYSTGETMPKIKSILGLHELATPQQCSDQLSNLREHFDAAGGDAGASHQGVPLSKYLLPLRDLASPPVGSTWDDVFDAVDDLIDAAIEEHEAEYHPDGPPDADASAAMNASAAAPAAPQEPIQMAMTAEETQAINDLKSQVGTLQSQLTAKDAQISTLSTELGAKTSELNAKAAETQTFSTQLQTATTQLSLKSTEVDTLKAEVTTLATAQAETKAKEADARVTDVIKIYGTKKGLTEASRPMLTHLCTSAPTIFDAEYPALPADQQHLLTNHTKGGEKDPKTGAELPEMTLMSIASEIAAAEKIPFDQALNRAEKILNQAKKKKS